MSQVGHHAPFVEHVSQRLTQSVDVDRLLQQPPLPAQQKSAEEIEREQVAKLKAKYGGLQPKRKLMPKVSAHHKPPGPGVPSRTRRTLSLVLRRSTNSSTPQTGRCPSKASSPSSPRRWGRPIWSRSWRHRTISLHGGRPIWAMNELVQDFNEARRKEAPQVNSCSRQRSFQSGWCLSVLPT